MPDIHITVRERVAQTEGDPEIVCGNSDYTAIFDFDAEWVAYPQKTMRTVWRDTETGRLVHVDTLFTGSSAALPPVWRTNQALVGVYAGDIRTTTAAWIPCTACITDAAPHHDDPDDALYEQLLDYLANLDRGGSKPEVVAPLTSGVPVAGAPENTETEPETEE